MNEDRSRHGFEVFLNCLNNAWRQLQNEGYSYSELTSIFNDISKPVNLIAFMIMNKS